jgi:hypothetical protein
VYASFSCGDYGNRYHSRVPLLKIFDVDRLCLEIPPGTSCSDQRPNFHIRRDERTGLVSGCQMHGSRPVLLA